ncbi:PrsW family glutamic-type intramembrane protease [Streptococcus pluranimalium]
MIKPSEAFIADWGAAVSAPFAEEFSKGLVVLLVLLIPKKMDLKNALVSGLFVGLSFQIVEDCIFTFQEMFVAKGDGFSTLIVRIVHAGGTHWTFSLVFTIGMVALLAKKTGLSKRQGAFWLFLAILAHFMVNSPFNEGITSKSANVTIAILYFNFCLALAAIKTVD